MSVAITFDMVIVFMVLGPYVLYVLVGRWSFLLKCFGPNVICMLVDFSSFDVEGFWAL
jgi:hypothetical protein